MVKGSQKIVTILILAVLLGSVISTLLPLDVHAAKPSVSEKGLRVLHDFFGLDLSKYTTAVEENCLSEPFLGNAPYETALFSLTSSDHKLKIAFTFANDHLQNMYIFENTGIPLLTLAKKSNDVTAAQSFLSRYEQYSSQPFFGNLKSTLDSVAVNKNYTIPVGNAVLDVTVYNNKGVTNFMWQPTTNNDTAAPNTAIVALGFKDGCLVSFTDTWTLNNNNKPLTLLKNNQANNSPDVNNLANLSPSDTSTLLTVVSGIENSVALFVMAVIVVVVGSVFVVRTFSQGLKDKSSFRQFFAKKKISGLLLCLLMLMIVFLPIAESANALPASGGVIWGSRSSGAPNDLNNSHSWRKTNAEINRQEYINNFIMSNCLIAANGYAGFSNIWTDKNSVLSQAQNLNTAYGNVAVFNWDHGVGGYPGAIPSSSFYSGVPPDELHYMFEDDWGTLVGGPSDYTVDWNHGVYDMDIYEAFSAGNVHFALINTCLSANTELFGQGFSSSGHPLGMPFAFTHRLVGYVPAGSNSSLMSNDGYNRPDAFPQCYIGFPFGSAALDQHISYNGNWQPWYQWVVFFCYMAFNFDVSVNEALDWACSTQWGCPFFGVSPLQEEGFTAIWPVWDDTDKAFTENNHRAQGPKSTLAVYGNGNIHLKNFQANPIVTYPYVSGPKSGVTNMSVNFSAYSVNSLGHDVRYVFDWGDDTAQTTTNYTTTGIPVSASHSWGTSGVYTVIVRAQCTDGTWSDWSESHTIAIINPYYRWSIVVVTGLLLSGIIIMMLTLHRHSKSSPNKNK